MTRNETVKINWFVLNETDSSILLFLISPVFSVSIMKTSEILTAIKLITSQLGTDGVRGDLPEHKQPSRSDHLLEHQEHNPAPNDYIYK